MWIAIVIVGIVVLIFVSLLSKDIPFPVSAECASNYRDPEAWEQYEEWKKTHKEE